MSMDSADKLELAERQEEGTQPKQQGKRLRDLSDRELGEATVMSVQQLRREVQELRVLVAQMALLLESAVIEEVENKQGVILTPRGN